MENFPQKVLLATDGSEEAAQAARAAVRLAALSGSELHVVHVGQVPTGLYPPGDAAGGGAAELEKVEGAIEQQARRRLDREVEKIREQGGEVAEAHLRMGGADEIVAVSEELGADLVVVGSRGLSDMKRMVLGSVSESVVRHAHCPVLVVRQ